MEVDPPIIINITINIRSQIMGCSYWKRRENSIKSTFHIYLLFLKKKILGQNMILLPPKRVKEIAIEKW